MPRLPDVLDYGQRPSVRSDRIDMPDRSGSILAESLASAQDTFVAMAKERQAKNQRMNYALAKNEALKADIEAREQLRDDEDWATYDDRYSDHFNSRRDEIVAKYLQDPEDRALFQAETDLIRERGRINVANASREVELDEKSTDLNRQLMDLQESYLLADPETANDHIYSAIEALNSAEAEGIINDVENLKERTRFVQGLVTRRLTGMNPKLREKELERSLVGRQSTGPISIEDIQSGKGTGSIADFLPQDVAKKMLDVTKKEDELDTEYEQAMALRDKAMELFPEDSQAMMKWVRDNSKGMEAKTRARAEQLTRQIAEERRVIDANERNDIMISAGELLSQTDDDGGFVYGIEDLPRDQMAKLSPGQRAQLEAYHSQLRNGRQFAEFTNWHREVRDENGELVKPAYSTWTQMSPDDKAKTDLTSPMWYTNFEQGPWKQMADEQERIRGGGAQAREKSIQTLDQIVTDVWAGELGLPRTGREDDEDEMYYLMRSRIASEIDQASDEKYGGQAVPDDVRKDIARKVMGAAVWERDAGIRGLVYGRDAKKPIPAASVDPDNFRDYFVPIERWRNLETKVQIGNPPEEVSMTWEERLMRYAEANLDGRKPDKRDLENAYAQIVIGGDPQDVWKRVNEALAGEYEY